MKSPTKSPYWGKQSRLRQVDQDPAHYRSGRWVLLAEAIVVGALGLTGLIGAAHHPGGEGWGVPVLVLHLTVPHSLVLLAFAVLSLAALPSKHWTARITGLGAVGFMLLFTFSTVAATDRSPGRWGFDAGDAVLHCVLLIVNLALLVWLLPDELQDPGWVWKRGEHPDPANPDSASGSDSPGRR